MLLIVPVRFRVMICALLAIWGAAGCDSGVGGGSGRATASGGTISANDAPSVRTASWVTVVGHVLPTS